MAPNNDALNDTGELFSHGEIERINQIYSSRGYDSDFLYYDTEPVYLQRTHSVERATLTAFSKLELVRRLMELRVLDFGCGNGRWMCRWVAWGILPKNMSAADVRDDALHRAREYVPQADYRLINEKGLSFSDESFDIVYQNLVFSSILEDDYRKHAASEIDRVLKPGGFVFWYDFTFNNPSNPNVRRVTFEEVKKLFPDYTVEFSRKVVLAPPLAKRVVPVSRLMADILEGFPFLRTHLFIALSKPRCAALADVGEIKLRQAKKEGEDISDIVNVHMAAFPGFALTLIGSRFLNILYNAFIQNNDGVLMVAVHNEKVIGFAAGAIHPEHFFRRLKLTKGLLFLFPLIVSCVRQPKLVYSRMKMAIFW